jgi:hypothetical protein
MQAVLQMWTTHSHNSRVTPSYILIAYNLSKNKSKKFRAEEIDHHVKLNYIYIYIYGELSIWLINVKIKILMI